MVSSALLERVRRRSRERGAAVFMVVMVLTLVSAIGVFSMRSASLVDLASGYNRQNVQATFVAEYAARAAATYLERNPGVVTTNVRVAGCGSALLAANADATCAVLKDSLLDTSFRETAERPYVNNLSGLLSLPDEPTQIGAEFVTELTEPAAASVTASPGFSSGLFKQITLTSISRVYPTDATGAGVCSPASRGSVSQQVVRAHAVVPL
jgi:Tfp pilus assembly protein PilX